MPSPWPAVLLSIVCASAAARAQEKVTEFELLQLMNEQHRAAGLYRSGDLDEALSIVARRSPSLNYRIAQRLVQWLQQPKGPQRDRTSTFHMVEIVDHWEPSLVVALGSLQMERALRIYEERAGIDTYETHVQTARLLFDEASRRGHPAKAVLQRWILAIGSTAHGDGELWWAAAILEEGCRDHRGLVELLVACGAAHESIAMLPAHILLTGGASSKLDEAQQFSVQTQQDARRARNRRLDSARGALESALELTAAHAEARLRLANVLAEVGDTKRAQMLLDAMLRDHGVDDRRTAFLTRLLAGRLRHRAGAAEDALAPLREAVELVPSAQSSYVALASALHATGRTQEAATVVDRMLAAPATPPDPWASYGYGQYWRPEPLLASLREEARR